MVHEWITYLVIIFQFAFSNKLEFCCHTSLTQNSVILISAQHLTPGVIESGPANKTIVLTSAQWLLEEVALGHREARAQPSSWECLPETSCVRILSCFPNLLFVCWFVCGLYSATNFYCLVCLAWFSSPLMDCRIFLISWTIPLSST